MADRPILIAIIAILTIIMALFLILAGILFVIGGDIIANIDDPSGMIDALGASLGVGFLIIGIIAFVVGYGFWKGWTVFWYIGVILYAIAAISGIYGLIVGQPISLVSLVIALVILFYLSRPKVREFFKV